VKNKMTDLRNHLFETLEALKDADKPMDLARARAISDVAQTIINSAKVEIEFLEAIDSCESTEFFGAQRFEERMPKLISGERR
jgi:tRNA(His) 5'-end guanylyltransferase